MKVLLYAAGILAALLIPASLVSAKGEQPAEITIEGPGITTPIAVTDPATLKAFQNFRRPILAYVGEPYRISFFDKDSQGDLTLSPYYVLDYYANPSGGPGYVFDPYVETESRWSHATPEGDALMQRLLKANAVAPPSPAPSLTTSAAAWSPWTVVLFTTLMNGLVSLWLLRRYRALAKIRSNQ
jgi:hypothetical protein